MPRGVGRCTVPAPITRPPGTCGSVAKAARRPPRPAESVPSLASPAAAQPLPPRPAVAPPRPLYPVATPVATGPRPSIPAPAPPLLPLPEAPSPRPPLPARLTRSSRPASPRCSPPFALRTRLRSGSLSEPELPASDLSPTLLPADELEAFVSAVAEEVPRDPAAPRPPPRRFNGLRTSRRVASTSSQLKTTCRFSGIAPTALDTLSAAHAQKRRTYPVQVVMVVFFPP